MDKCQYDDATVNAENVVAHDRSASANLDELYVYDGLNCLADEKTKRIILPTTLQSARLGHYMPSRAVNTSPRRVIRGTISLRL